MTTTLDVLRAARALIAKGWTQGALARDAEGNDLGCDSEEAVSFCALGAVECAVDAVECEDWEVLANDAIDELEALTGAGCTASLHNDNVIGSQAEALAWFDRAIRATRAS